MSGQRQRGNPGLVHKALACALLCVSLCAAVFGAAPVEPQRSVFTTGIGQDRGRMLADLAQQHRRTDSQLSISYAEEAAELLDSSGDHQSLALTYDVLAWHKLTQGQLEQALSLSDDALALAGTVTSDALNGQMHYTRGAIQLTRGSVTLALQAFRRAAQYYEAAQDQSGQARAYSAIGGCYRHYSEFDAAMAWQHKAYEVAMQTDDPDVQSTVLNNLGDLYDYLGQPSKALDYYRKSLELEQGEQFGLVVKNLNVGTQYQALGQYQDALGSYQLALSYNRKLQLGQHEPEILVAMASAYLAMGELREALRWSLEALDAAQRSAVDVQIIAALNGLSKTYIARENYAAAINASERALGLAQSQEVPDLIIRTLRQLATAYKEAGQFHQAVLTLELYTSAKEKQLLDKATRSLAELQAGLETEVAEREIVRLQQENQIRDLQLEQERSQRMLWIAQIVFLVLAIAILVLLYLRVQRKSRTDELTQIANRSYISDCLEQEFRRFQRYENPCCVMILDIDDFKEFNDVHGHDCGDAILTAVAGLLSQCLRTTDRVGRWGGEEFVLLFPQTGLTEALQVAERIRLAVANYRFSVDSRHSDTAGALHVSITSGLALLSKEDEDVVSWLKRADLAMYEGKQAGKNCVCASAGRSEQTPSVVYLPGATSSVNA
ncbi:MAG: GGDEF domain-containing protein [Halieaceae bacterium]